MLAKHSPERSSGARSAASLPNARRLGLASFACGGAEGWYILYGVVARRRSAATRESRTSARIDRCCRESFAF